MSEGDLLQLARSIGASPSPYHCVAQVIDELGDTATRLGFPDAAWEMEPGKTYYVTYGATIIAWRMGNKPADKTGVRAIAAHTDSPGFRVKAGVLKVDNGHVLLDVHTYGGLLPATWCDRPLGIAGRVMQAREGGGAPVPRLVLSAPLCIIPRLAIHLDRKVAKHDDPKGGLRLNPHTHLRPILTGLTPEDVGEGGYQALFGEQVLGHDLALYPNVTPRQVGEYFLSPRLDNQAMVFAAVAALTQADPSDHTQIVAFFDHEECGSRSTTGAMGPTLEWVLQRLVGGDAIRLQQAVAQSMLVSADMVHALHPNYADRHDGTHAPRINAGPVAKHHPNQRYGTSDRTAAIWRGVCQQADVPCQEFAMRADLACGTTVGPILSGGLGIPTVDVGNPMWAMHSAVETMGAKDHPQMVAAMRVFLAQEGLLG